MSSDSIPATREDEMMDETKDPDAVKVQVQVTAAPATTPTLHPITDLDLGVVAWDNQSDPQNPLNFSNARKWGLLALVSSISFVTPLASSMFAPAAGLMAEEFDEENLVVVSLSVSVFLLGFVVGPLILGPLSELYGRRVVLGSCNLFFFVWQIGCALAPNTASLIVFRLLAGIGGSGPLTLGGGIIADLFPIHKRGRAMAIWSLGPLVGPVVGPIAGGFVGQHLGWRWIYWVLAIASAAVSIGIEVLNQETFAPVLIARKTKTLAKRLNRSDLRSYYQKQDVAQDPAVLAMLMLALKRPFIIFVKSPIVFLLSMYMSVIYGLLYLFFTTISPVFESEYGFSPQLSGLAYLGIGLGFFIGIAIFSATSDRTVMKLTARNSGRYEPEFRLRLVIVFSFVLPVSFFWYGWSVDRHAHWIVPIVGTIPFSLGMMNIFMPVQTYVVDCFNTYAASAIATLTASRSLAGALLPLAGLPLYQNLGYGWGNSLLGFIAVACIPIPVFFTKYGKKIRERHSIVL
ncbi:hypothetical protein AYO21_10620 [Fonsecaea monophora]|uniref:Major facilitator superfamily (MFS) profile domain-containing protein n=1 Tax=Fonsecaea monophora TaxID=254056 RepID=A0A177EVZ1_9EURO|nr:hypothetical protein AYO21_10620 [Fonsecaea monophora]KAH0829714.1 putative transporter [Fonsecaea pedrosoi]OAG35222.1 hypothetical protein AYO21_10620 [Fonsecaea monophora]